MEDDFSFLSTISIVFFASMVLGHAVAELLRRLSLYWEESYHTATRYNGSKTKVFRASLSFCVAYGCLCAICLIIISIFATSYSACFLVVIPTYCILYLVLHLTGKMKPRESYLQNLDEMQISFGNVFAWQIYSGYLKIILPSFLDRVHEFEKYHGVRITVPKLFVLLPESCNLACDDISKHEVDRDSIQFVNNLTELKRDRNGVKNRKYTNPVYRITTSNDAIYCCMEGAAILNSLHDMNEAEKLTGLTDEKMEQARIAFVSRLQQILNDNGEGHLVELVSYKDLDEDGNQVKISDVIQQRIGQILMRSQEFPL